MSLQHVFTSDIKGGCFISDSLRSSPEDNSELQDIYWGKTPMKEIRTWAEVDDERLQIIIVPIHIKGKKRWIHSTCERQVPIPAFSRTPTDPEPSTVLYIPCVCVCKAGFTVPAAGGAVSEQPWAVSPLRNCLTQSHTSTSDGGRGIKAKPFWPKVGQIWWAVWAPNLLCHIQHSLCPFTSFLCLP